MFGIGSTELVIILIVALVLIGPSKLPDLMKSLGKGLSEFRRMSTDVKSTLEREIEKADEAKKVEETRKELFGEEATTAQAATESGTSGEARPAASVQADAGRQDATPASASAAPAASAQGTGTAQSATSQTTSAGVRTASAEGVKPGSSEGVKPGSSEGVTPGAADGVKPGSSEGLTSGSAAATSATAAGQAKG